MLDVQALEVAGVGQHLRDYGPPRLGVPGQLHLDDDQPAGGFHRQEVRVAGAQPGLAAQHGQPGRSGQRQHLRRALDQVMQLGLGLVRSRRERMPLTIRT